MKEVKEFYNKTPFPNYELKRFNNVDTLKAVTSKFARQIDLSIPENANVVDVGTGTGQLSAFLSLRRKVTGLDFATGSLSKAISLKQKLGLDNLSLEVVDISKTEEIDSVGCRFDYLLCLGVLHHTSDPKGNFKNILRLLKPGGKVAVGLYNTYGRIPLNFRQFMYKHKLGNIKKYLKLQIDDLSDKEKYKGWLHDQFMHVHESTHTIGEVLRWFKKNNIEYTGSMPYVNPLREYNDFDYLWDKSFYPILPLRIYNQLKWVYTTHKEGGYWITFGKKL